MNYFDLGVIAIVGLSALLSFYRGLVREILSLGGWMVATIVTLKYLDPATHFMKQEVKSEALAIAVAAIGLFILTLVGITIVTSLIMKFLKPGDKVGLLDNLGGLAFGIARGALIVGIGFIILTKLFTDEKDYPKMVQHALTRPYVEQAAAWVSNLSPEYLEKAIPKAEKDAKEGLKKASKALDEKTDAVKEKINKADDDATEKPMRIPSLKDLQERMEKENEEK